MMKQKERLLDLGRCVVHGFSQCEGEDTWLGTLFLFGTPYHFQAIRVHEVGNAWVATNDPHQRLDDVFNLYDYRPTTTQIPGLDGEFVIVIHPHGD
jgi:hypothetical protein